MEKINKYQHTHTQKRIPKVGFVDFMAITVLCRLFTHHNGSVSTFLPLKL